MVNLVKEKTFLSYLLANSLNGTLCKTFNPTDPGDELQLLNALFNLLKIIH